MSFIDPYFEEVSGAHPDYSRQRLTVENTFSKSAFEVNLLRPATYTSLSFASWSVLSFLRSGLDMYTLIGRFGSTSCPCSWRAFSAAS